MNTILLFFRKFTALFSLIAIMMSGGVFGQGSEDFTNIPTTSVVNYLNRTWSGTNSESWTSTDSRVDQTINTKAITIRNGVLTFGLTNAQKAAGIGSLTLKAKAPFGSPDVGVLDLIVNGTSAGPKSTTGSNNTAIVTYTWTGINVGSIISIVLNQTSTGARITIDDIGWTSYVAGFTVTFNNNGGIGTMSNQTATTATNLTANTFTRSGYTFSGWNTLANGSGTAYANSASYPFTANETLYAQWTPNFSITFANLQFPPSGNIPEGGTFEIFGQVYAVGLTEAVGQGAGITAEFGYSTSNTNPSTWTNWQSATYNNVEVGNNDEYKTTFSVLALGTYYYATRFRYGSEPWIYGGYRNNSPSLVAGGIWDGVSNISGVLTVNSNVVDFANLEAPFIENIIQGVNFNANAKVYKNGITNPAGGSTSIIAWIGISTTNASTTANFTDPTWTWVSAIWDSQPIGSNDDIYTANIAGAGRPAGTYYYVSRFSVAGSTEYRYGGINNGFWTAPANSGVLTITKPTIVLTPTTLSGFNYTGASGPSAQQSFTASGTQLIANIVISAPTFYEVSTTSGSGFGSSVTLIQTAGFVNSTLIYVRLKAGLAAGTYNQSVVVTTTSGTNQTVTLNGSVTAATAPYNALNLKACVANNQITLSWDAATGGATGYMVFARGGSATPSASAVSAGNASNYIADANYSNALTATPSTLGRVLYKGNLTTVTITGLINSSSYTFKVVAYNSETGTGWSPGINTTTPNSWMKTYFIDVPEILNLSATSNPNSSTVTWNVVPNSVGCYEYMVVANAGAVSLTPAGDGTSYVANTIYTGANQVVYKGTGNSVIVTGLTEGSNYCYKVFVRELNSGNQWSDGTSICKTAEVVYCNSQGLSGDETGITSVVFNTINQISTGASDYTNFTSVSTTVALGATHNLTVKVNTDGFQNVSKAWIDWNKDGDFNDSGEEYDLGDAYVGTNEVTSNSPLAITIPSNANIGTTRMRVATQYFFNDSDIILAPCETYDFGEVEDYTINIIQPLTAEINVKGGTISIANGFDAPFSLNNTLFASTTLNTDSAEKAFTIENIGIANLTLSGSPIIKIEGLNPSDFIVTQQAVTPVINGTPTSFKIKFNPTVAGTRTATVRIESNDSDENPYLFTIEGTGTCTVVPTIAMFPASGPANTLVSFTSSTSILTGATVSYNNIVIPLVSVTTDKIEVVIPANANDGNFTIQLVNGCGKTQAFDVIDTQLTSCDAIAVGGTTTASDLIIYEVYDENGGNGGVVTIYNRTGVAVPLAGYSIKRAANYGGTYTTYANLTGTLAAGAVAVIGVSSSPCGYATTGNGSFGTAGFNENDGFRLLKGSVLVDDVKAPNYKGYYLKRKSTFLNPNILYNDSEWTKQGVASGECLTGVGTQPIVKIPPTVTLNSQYLINCAVKNTSLTVAGTEGFAGGLALAYQWYALGTTGNWTEIINGGIYAGATSPTLTISNISGLDDFQYYCQIRENGANCYAASQTSLLRIPKKTWNGTAWSGDALPPTASQKAIITGTYNSATNGGDIKACECEVTATGIVNMNANHTLDIQGKITNAGVITILDSGSLVQHNDSAINSGNIKMERISKPMLRQDYTYWSSPVQNFALKNVSPATSDTKFFKWKEDTQVWSAINPPLAHIMEAGRGYIVRAPSTIQFPVSGTPGLHTANFIGVPNNGVVTMSVKGSVPDDEDDENPLNPDSPTDNYYWNLIGNPYPSAIDAEIFMSSNSSFVAGTLYLWTHNTPLNPSSSLGYAINDYASWNGTGGVGTTAAATSTPETGNNYNIPTANIAAGQSFFIRGITDGMSTVTFNNSMRVDGSAGKNSQFFRTAAEKAETPTTIEKHRVWLNLTGAQNAFNQTLVGYVTDATNAYDLRFDGESFGGNKVTFYSVLDTKNLVIQGRALPFTDLDTVPLGYNTTLTGNLTISIDQVDGLMETQGIYLQDNLLNVVHDLKASNYTFATVPGTFDSRFVLRYSPQADLSNPTFNDQVKAVKIYKNKTALYANSPFEEIAAVAVYDIAGRLIFEAKNCNTNRFETNKVNAGNQALIIKVTLSNGAVITQKVL